MITKDLQSAQKLVNNVLNNVIDRWGSSDGGRCYLLRHTENSSDDHIEIQPTYSNAFYGISEFIHIAEVCGCSFYVVSRENQDGILAPTVCIY